MDTLVMMLELELKAQETNIMDKEAQIVLNLVEDSQTVARM